jgi:hypothetical protein
VENASAVTLTDGDLAGAEHLDEVAVTDGTLGDQVGDRDVPALRGRAHRSGRG